MYSVFCTWKPFCLPMYLTASLPILLIPSTSSSCCRMSNLMMMLVMLMVMRRKIFSHLPVQPFLQPSQVSALRKFCVRKFLRVVCRWVHNQVHLREDFNYQCSGKRLKRCHLSKRVQGFDEDRLNVSWTGVVAGGEVDLVLPVQGAGEKVLKRWIISSKAGNRICNGAETWRRYMYDEDFYGQCECGHKVKVILLRMDRGHTSTLLILQSLIAAHHNFDNFFIWSRQGCKARTILGFLWVSKEAKKGTDFVLEKNNKMQEEHGLFTASPNCVYYVQEWRRMIGKLSQSHQSLSPMLTLLSLIPAAGAICGRLCKGIAEAVL